MLAAFLWLGFLLGLRHAFEADHLAAVTSLASRSTRLAHTMRVAAAWGLGHAAVLTATGTLMVALGAAWPPGVGRALEALAGAVLVWLGVDVLRRARRAATLQPAAAGAPPLSRALLVGGVHGMEGSGAVVLLALPALRGYGDAFAYLGVFGVGSIAGMLLCSLAVSLPMDAAAQRFAGAGRALQLAVGATSVLLGGSIAGRALYPYIRSIFT